ncbi:MAG: polyprenyl synthetase family protein, partial [Acidobacteria bacterium]|nr:polyprenyl synthetase family protein [Acidobacteriota bacterium]
MNGGVPFDEYLDARRREVDAALDEAVPAPPACPPRVAEAMRYSVFAGGKRLRPILTLAAAEAAGPRRRVSSPGNDQLDLREELSEDAARGLALNGACAIELVHTYSLVHDDLPAMDDDTLRRGRPTSHVVFGEGLAILAGDALLTQAFALLARRPPHAPPGFEARQLRAVARVADAAGAGRRGGGAGCGPPARRPGAGA